MGNNAPKNIIENVVGWLQGFFSQGAKQLDREPRGRDGSAQEGSGRQELPDLDATESDYEYSGEPSNATAPPEQAGSGGPASRAAEQIEEAHASATDIDEAQGIPAPEDAPLPSDSTDQNEVYHLHDAVGGREAPDDDGTDARIDTGRDDDLTPEPPDQPLNLNDEIDDVSGQDELTAFEGARTDEFRHGGYEPAHVEPDDVEAAAEGEGTALEDEVSTSNIGDLGAGQTDPDSGIGYDPESTDRNNHDLSGTDTRNRESIESTAEADAFVQGDEAVTAPGQSPPEDFDDATTGTTEPSRSATGNELDDTPDALGTTLDHTDESSETFDPDTANLSDEEEFSVSDLEGDEQPGSVSGENSTRGTTFRSGTIDPEPRAEGDDVVDAPEHPYAGIPDEPTEEPSEDSELDDFSGSDYPSDRRIDRLAGDDAFDAVEPDVQDPLSSAGDLDTVPPRDDLLISEEPPAESADPGMSEGKVLDENFVGADDDSIGDAPGTLDMAAGTAEGTTFADTDDEMGATTLQEAADDDTQATPQAIVDDGGAGSASSQDDMPVGAVRGDGTTQTPDGYPVKGNASSKIYHLPNFPSYAGTKPEFCFATEQDAINAGYRAPGRRNRGRGKRS